MVQPEPVTLDVQLEPFVASVPQRQMLVELSVTVQHAEPDVVLEEHPSGTASAPITTPTTAHTCRMLHPTSAIARTSPRAPGPPTARGPASRPSSSRRRIR